MGGPWEDYQQKQENGPWEDYKQPQSGGIMGALRDFAGGIARAGFDAGPAQFGTMSPGEAAEQAPSGIPKQEAAAAIPPAENPYIGAMGEAAGNPVTWAGPGGPILKGAGAALSAIGGQAGEDVGGTPGRIAGSILGGVAAAKTLAPKPVTAANPTLAELKDSYNGRYAAARDSGLKLDSRGPAVLGQIIERRSIEDGFSGGQFGTAPKTFATLQEIQSERGPEISASGLDAVRKRLGKIARETNDGKPTEDAAAATAALKDYNKYLENIPQSHIVAGDPEAYIRNTRLGNQDYMAAQQLRDAQNRTNAAVKNYEGSIAARLDNQLKSQFRPILKSEAKQRGLSDEQLAAIEKLNKGSLAQRAGSQIGRFTPFSPVGFALHAASAIPTGMATGGASILPQIAIGLGIHAARKFGERSTLAQAGRIANLAAQRSALYQQRLKDQPAQSNVLPSVAQIVRGGVLGLR